MNQSGILISVIMTNYNHGHYLKERLASILSQIPPNSEVIFVDDASTDDSLTIIEEIANKDSRVRIFCNPHNLGVVPTCNSALQHATGRYICSMSADDIILPGFFEKTLGFLQKHVDIPICCSDCGMIFEEFEDRDPERIYTTVLLKTNAPFHVFTAEKVISVFRTTNFWIPGHTSIIKREALLEFGGFEEKLGFLCDWFLFHAIALKGGVGYIPETLSIWRLHQNNFHARQNQDTKKRNAVYLQFLDLLFHRQYKPFRKLFKKAKLVNFYAKVCFWSLLIRPKHYDLVMIIGLQVFRNRFRKYWGMVFTAYKRLFLSSTRSPSK